jgi:predicted CopG family antitoxin
VTQKAREGNASPNLTITMPTDVYEKLILDAKDQYRSVPNLIASMLVKRYGSVENG